MKSTKLKLVRSTDMRPVTSAGRKANDAYRVREHLTECEIDKLLKALKANRHGHRDWLIYRHGLRVSEACDLRWDDIDLAKRTGIAQDPVKQLLVLGTQLLDFRHRFSQGCWKWRNNLGRHF